MNKRALLIHGGIILAIILIGIGPLLITLGAGLFASINGCTLHEGFSNPCVVFGVDWGDRLYAWGVMGWMAIVTVPVAFLFFMIYVGVMAVRWFMRRSRPDDLV